MKPVNQPQQTLHASCVAFKDFGVLMIGPSGSGKSSLALRLMALGAVLVSDDKTHLSVDGETIAASAPKTIQGLIEARGIGLISAENIQNVRISLVIDMSITEKHRLPPSRCYNVLGQSVALLHKVETDYFPAAILQIAKVGRLPFYD